VSAFGLTGTNVHVVLGEAPVPAPSAEHADRPLLLPLSAKSPATLRLLAGRYADLISTRVGADPTDVCYSAGARRSHYACRMAVVGKDRDALLDELRSVEAGYDCSSVLNRLDPGVPAPQVVFVFAGQGTQRDGMARELLDAQPCFREWMLRCDRAIAAEAGWSVIERLRDDTPLTSEEEIQPAVWAIEVSLAAMWRDWGIEPDLVIGHSMGEVAAAVTSGALSLQDGANLICRRSGLLSRIRGAGAMWAVQVGDAEAALAIADQDGEVSIAAINGDHSTTLSGDADALATVVGRLRGSGVYCKQLRVGCASHARQVDPITEELRVALADLRPAKTGVPMYSTVLDRRLDGRELDGAYWVRNLRQPVLFGPAVRAAIARQPRTLFIEMSPHSVLVHAIEDLAESAAGDQFAVASLCRDQSELETVTAGLAAAYTHGCQPRWERVHPNARYVPVPGHPWQHRSYWVDTPTEPAVVSAVQPLRPARPFPDNGVDDDLIHRIVRHTAHVLAMPAEEVDPSVPLLDSGLDSLLATKLSTRIKQELGVQVPARRLLTQLSLVDLAEQLNQQLLAGQAS
jgi:acyl transferase domain-containing protein